MRKHGLFWDLQMVYTCHLKWGWGGRSRPANVEKLWLIDVILDHPKYNCSSQWWSKRICEGLEPASSPSNIDFLEDPWLCGLVGVSVINSVAYQLSWGLLMVAPLSAPKIRPAHLWTHRISLVPHFIPSKNQTPNEIQVSLPFAFFTDPSRIKSKEFECLHGWHG